MDSAETTVKALEERTRPVKRTRVKKAKKQKRVKLESKAKIRRRLMKKWADRARLIYNGKCALCGISREENPHTHIDAHHLATRQTAPSLRFDPNNAICLCAKHHKFSKISAHKGSVFFYDWLRKYHTEQYDYVLAHMNDDIDLENRETLSALEQKLDAEISKEELSLHNPEAGILPGERSL